MSETHHSHNIYVPLRKWIQDEIKRKAIEREREGSDQTILLEKQALLRKITVAYGIVELLIHARTLSSATLTSTSTSVGECSLDNFVVHVSRQLESDEAAGSTNETKWDDVSGVNMISPALSGKISEPSFVTDADDENIENRMGKYQVVDITPPLVGTVAPNMGKASKCNDCRLFGDLLYELFTGTGTGPFPSGQNDNNTRGSISLEEEPPRKRSAIRYDKKKGKSYSTLQKKHYSSLKELGFPSSVSMLVQNLIDGHEEYSSLDSVSSDIHLLLSDPDCYLFDFDDFAVQGGNVQLQIKKGKLYGREQEETLITDAFCRVSSGKNEAFFIGGFSGSGKTMLVKSVIARVDIAGGYVLTQKVDQMSKERPLLDVLSAFNNLCLLIKEKISPQELFVISNKLTHDFESDFSVLARLLPNINILFPQLAKPNNKDKSVGQMMSLHNTSFTLQRFMRIVSSRLRPVMLFLDDLQWAGSTSLELIHSLLADTRGSSCFFFVGSYRDNEVKEGHAIFDLMSKLNSSGVESTKVHLGGLNKSDLNLMISESLCVFPRLCKPLSEVVFEKTEGNPYFALEFLKSLVDSRLLKYSLRERRWIWDEKRVCSENTTDNVLYILSARMTSLPENVQFALKIISCFGIKTDKRVIGYLSSTSEYSSFPDWLNQAINEGCINKVENGFKFVHDKVREAAYNLIPEYNKIQFHCNLGMLLYHASKGQDLNDAIFQIVDQINCGVPSLIQPGMRMKIAELNFNAGSRAMGFSDYKTAYSYLKNAHVLLTENHWHTHYELSLRAFFLRAKAAFSCGNLEKAEDLLKTILQKGLCIEDKLDAYYLLVTLLHASERGKEAYAMVCEVLSQLNETVPESLSPHEAFVMLSHTGQMLGKLSDAELLEMKTMDGTNRPTQRFYMLMGSIAYWHKPELLPFLACRGIQLSLEEGLCMDSIMSFVQYAAILCSQTKLTTSIQGAHRIGKIAISLFKRFNSPELVARLYFCYFGFVAVHAEPLQICTDHLRKGFEVGISAGESEIAFYNSIHLVRTALLGGENLSSLLKETDYHLEVMTRFRNKLSMPYLSVYRETISMIIDKGEATSPKNGKNNHLEEATSDSLYAQRHNETIYFNRVLQAFWLGYYTRCHHYSKKALEMTLLGRHNKLVILFYAALNNFLSIKNNNGNGSQILKVRALYKEAMAALQSAAKLSPLNFNNKVYLLEAELNSFERKYEAATSSYDTAISSCSSGYIHEQGLAYELAGIHYTKIGEVQTALEYLHQAKQCYLTWGSKLKANAITQRMKNVNEEHTLLPRKVFTGAWDPAKKTWSIVTTKYLKTQCKTCETECRTYCSCNREVTMCYKCWVEHKPSRNIT